MNKTKYFLLFVCASSMMLSCKKDKEEGPTDTSDPNANLKAEIVSNYADMVYASYEDSYDLAVVLDQKIDAFIASPSALTLADAKQAWLDAREPYGQTEVYRFYGGAIDDGDGPEPFLNSWPLDEAYIDYVIGNSTSGIINNTAGYPSISESLLLSLNQSGAEENVALGFHAIEFLLWGQDTSDNNAGLRQHTDYLTTGGTAANQARRAQYLSIASDVLVAFLFDLKEEWSSSASGNYRSEFLALDKNEAIRKMMVGMAILSKNELAGERMYVAYDNQDQEDEHSCFSDNTHRDIILNAKGIHNVYIGTYQRVDGSFVTGSSIEDLAAILSPTLNTQVLTSLSDADTKCGSIYVPFDQAIVLPAERVIVLDAVTHLQSQGDLIVQLAAAMGYTIVL
jgi:putative iron-regulated protein